MLLNGALAQGNGGAAVAGVLALVEAVDPDRVEALRAEAVDDAALALALLTSLEEVRLLDPGMAAVMRAFVTADGDSVSTAEGPIEFDENVMNLFLLDLVPGTEPLASVLHRYRDVNPDGRFEVDRTGSETLDVSRLLLDAQHEYAERALWNITFHATGFVFEPSRRLGDEPPEFDPLPVGGSPSLLRDAFEERSAVVFEPGDTVPGVVALLEFAHLIDPTRIEDLDLPDGATPFETAQALLESLREQGLLDPQIAASMESLIEMGGEAPPGLLDFLWVDMVTGDADLEDVFAAAVDAAIASGRVGPEGAEALSMKMGLPPGTSRRTTSITTCSTSRTCSTL